MNRRIVPGDTVEIIHVHSSSAYYSKEKEGSIVGKTITVAEITYSTPIRAYSAIQDTEGNFYRGLRVKRVNGESTK